MCTISWCTNNSGYSVFFNRDERIVRPRALLPQVYSLGGVKAIMPIDEQGGGTWLTVNEYGLSVALLNFYQGRLPKGRLISRGQIVKACAEKNTVQDVVALVKSLTLAQYAPFSLLIFAPISSIKVGDRGKDGVTLLQWSGQVLNKTRQQSPLISSAINFDTVYESRMQTYHTVAPVPESVCADDGENRHRSFHTSHCPAKSCLSVCMHRKDARTVSFSHINVSDKNIDFFYSDGAPCEATLALCASLPVLSKGV